MNIKETSKRNRKTQGEKQRRYRLNLMLIDKLGNQGLVEVGEKIWKAQVEELNYIMDQCLNSVADLAYIKTKLKLKTKSKSFNISANNTPINNSKPSDSIEHYKSLGIESALGEKEQLNNS